MRHALYNNVLSKIPKPNNIPCFNKGGKLIISLVEYRNMEEIDWVINAMLRVYSPSEIGFAIVFGSTNAFYIQKNYGHWINIILINTGHSNLNRGTYSALLKTPQLWENFLNWSHVLIYQTDACIFRKIDDVYFNYDYIGSMWAMKNQCSKYCAGNGGLSLRNVKKCIQLCEPNRNVPFYNIHRGNEDVFFCSRNDIFKYPIINSKLHNAFGIEAVYHETPIGCHRVCYCWDMNNEQYEKFIKYMEKNLLTNDKHIQNIKSETPELNELLFTQKDIIDYRNSQILCKDSFSDCKMPDESFDLEKTIPMNKPVNIGSFVITHHSHNSSNKWSVNSLNNYFVSFCKTNDFSTAISNHNVDRKHPATVHKKKSGCYYYCDNNKEYLVFYPGFETGGGSNSDVHAPWGNHWNHCRNLPKNGAVIIHTNNVDKYTFKSLFNSYNPTIFCDIKDLIKRKNYNVSKWKNIFEQASQDETKCLQLVSYLKEYNININDSLINKLNNFSIDGSQQKSIYDKPVLIYDLYCGVGYYNQLFSLEMGIYLANISNRHLIINMRHPLVACGRPDWNMGTLFDYITNDFEKYLPNGYTLYTKNDCIPCDTNLIDIPTKCSNISIIDDYAIDNINETDMKDFTHYRTQIYFNSYFDKLMDKNVNIVSFNKSNASRVLYNLYTTKQNYEIMNNICFALSRHNKFLLNISNKLVSDFKSKHKEYIAIHLRLGDWHKSVDNISSNNKIITDNLEVWLNNNNKQNHPIVIMTDRKDNPFFELLKTKYNIIFSDELISTSIQEELNTQYKSSINASFLIQKLFCEEASMFIGSQGSTVSVHIQYINYLNNKCYDKYTFVRCNTFNNKTLSLNTINNNKWGWKNKNYLGGHPLTWSMFFADNIIK